MDNREKMKILILQDDFPPQTLGGAGIVAFNLAQGLKKAGQDIFVITTVRDKKDEGEIEYSGMKIFRICTNYHERWRNFLSLNNPQIVKKVEKIINEIKPDIVHVHNIHYYLSYRCLKIAKQSGAKVFLTVHDAMLFYYGKLMEVADSKDLSCPTNFNYKISVWQQIKIARKRYNPFRNIVIRYYLKYVDKIFAISNVLKTALNQNGIKNVEVVYNGINAEDWHVDNFLIEEFKNKRDLQNKKVVLFGGRLSCAKGGRHIIFAMKKVVQEIPEAILLILGEKKGYAEKMLEFAQDSGIGNNVIFTGWLSGDELKSAYWVSDVVAVASIYFDPFNLFNIEAMACEKPVVGTCFGGTPEIVKDGITGYIINPLNTDLMAEKILDLLKNSQKAQEFGKAGCERVKDMFTLEKQVDKTLHSYKS